LGRTWKLKAGDEVNVRFRPTGGNKNIVQRITLVKPAAAAAAAAPTSAAYRPVSDARLVNPEPENWLLLRGNYQGWMYSPLEQINVSNVKDLAPVWTYSTAVDSGHEAPPIVNDGVMFVAAPYDKLIALNAKNGDLL
jgi:alcohol dehydrogenase (cytochrome c)